MKYLLFLLLFLTACASCSTKNPEEPAPVVVPAEGKELCPQACEAMTTKLTNADGGVGCEEGLPVPAPPDIISCTGDGCPELVPCTEGASVNECVTCVWYCEYAHEQGSFWNTSCIVNDIDTCAQIEDTCNIQ